MKLRFTDRNVKTYTSSNVGDINEDVLDEFFIIANQKRTKKTSKGT